MTDNETIKALDILDKMDFFEGQRAGRELWFDKPLEVQNEDIRDFAKDIAFLKDFINRQDAEIERYREVVGKLAVAEDGTATGLLNGKETKFIDKEVAETLKRFAVSEARKEFAERVKAQKITHHNLGELVYVEDIDNLLAEMESEGK